MLERAGVFFSSAQATDPRLAAKAIDDMKFFDIAGMHRAVAICACGRSGSVLLASYLDGHGNVILMPNLMSRKIYPFFERYQFLTLREKLIAFPFFQTPETDNFLGFFGGDFPVGAASYHAAVDAVFEVYGSLPAEVLESRRSFFQFLHVVYAVALGRRPATRQPMIVYAQHMLDCELARRFIEDFPQGRFIQTVRDPITNSSRLAAHSLKHRGVLGPWYVISYLTFAGLPHPDLEYRTMVIRFEDLHACLEETMRKLAGWLDIPYSPSLLDSTFHDRPYSWSNGAKTWTGIRTDAGVREFQHTFLSDRCLLFLLLNEDFVAWNYPCPNIQSFIGPDPRMCAGLVDPAEDRIHERARVDKVDSLQRPAAWGERNSPSDSWPCGNNVSRRCGALPADRIGKKSIKIAIEMESGNRRRPSLVANYAFKRPRILFKLSRFTLNPPPGAGCPTVNAYRIPKQSV